MRKYDFISALAKETAAEVVKNREEWMKYLTTAARLYKYPFREQLLIYAQRPDATACASIELWNERMHCWVNKGAHANITTGLAENKFGIAMRDMEAVIEEAAKMKNIQFLGLHFHIGSQILDMGDFEALCNRINELQNQLEAHHIVVKNINVGGGLGMFQS